MTATLMSSGQVLWMSSQKFDTKFDTKYVHECTNAIFFSAIASIGYGSVKKHLSFIKILAIAFGLIRLGYVGIGLVGSYWLIRNISRLPRF